MSRAAHYREVGEEMRQAALRRRHGWCYRVESLVGWIATGRYTLANFHDGLGLSPRDGGGLFMLVDPETLKEAQRRGYIWRYRRGATVTPKGHHLLGRSACPCHE